MGLITLAELRSDLKDASQRSGLADSKLNRHINNSIKEIAYGLKFHEFEAKTEFSTVEGTEEYRIGAALEIPITDLRAIGDDGLCRIAPIGYLGKLIPETRSSYLQQANLLESTAEDCPLYYHKYGSSVFLRPVPFATIITIELDYWKSIANITGNTDVSPIHEDWDDVIFLGALYRLFRNEGEYPRYMTTRNEFLSLLRTRSTEMELEPFPEGGISIIGQNDGPEVFSEGP